MKLTTGRIAFGLVLLLSSCTYKEIPTPSQVAVDCTQSNFAINLAAKTDATNCFLIDGNFTIGVTGGVSPYVFSLDGDDFEASSTFSNLGPGYYLITARDANLCERSMSVEIKAAGTDLAATVQVAGDSECLSDNGSIAVTASGGTAPYSFQFGTTAPDGAGSYLNLAHGYYSVIVRDNAGCIKTVNVLVPRLDTGTSFATDIQPIITSYCAISGCHNGDNGSSRNWTVFANVQANAQKIKTRTANRTMPLTGSLTQQQIDLIACWVDDGAKNN